MLMDLKAFLCDHDTQEKLRIPALKSSELKVRRGQMQGDFLFGDGLGGEGGGIGGINGWGSNFIS